MHQRSGNAADENPVAWPLATLKREIDGLRDLCVFEREKRRDVDAVPCRSERRTVFALDEPDAVVLSTWPVILGDLH